MVYLNNMEELRAFVEAEGSPIKGLPEQFERSRITLDGVGSSITFGKGVILDGAHLVIMADDAHISIGNGSVVKAQVRAGYGSRVRIGRRLSSTGGGSISAAEGAVVRIGDDCMFAIHIDVRADHGHPIFDRRTGDRVNPSRKVVIGDHVWLGPYVKVFPGAHVMEGSVIGSGSLVSGRIPANSVAVGTPARVVRRNIIWDKRHLCSQNEGRFGNLADLEGRHWESALPIQEHPAPVRKKKAGKKNRIARKQGKGKHGKARKQGQAGKQGGLLNLRRRLTAFRKWLRSG